MENILAELSEKELEAEGLNNLAMRLKNEGHFETAVILWRRCCNIDPFNYKWQIQLATGLIDICKIDEAENITRKLLISDRRLEKVQTLNGFIGLCTSDPNRTYRSFKAALQMSPYDPQTQFNLGVAYMGNGQWREGWYLLNTRWGNRVKSFSSEKTKWSGESDCELYVWSEQGVGDIIQFSRYIPLLKDKVKKVIFAIPNSLKAIFSNYTQYAEIVDIDIIPKSIDKEISLMELPMFFNEFDPSNVIQDPGILGSAEATGSLDEGFNVGIRWAGNPKLARDHHRSMKFTDLMPLFSETDFNYLSFQDGERVSDIFINRCQSLVTDLSSNIEPDWSCAATVLKFVDVLVTVDTGLAHIAGALNIPTILCLAPGIDWRWGYKGNTTPWYPSFTIVRQKKFGDWSSVVEEVRSILRKMYNDKRSKNVIS
jgi:hypothetical protein